MAKRKHDDADNLNSETSNPSSVLNTTEPTSPASKKVTALDITMTGSIPPHATPSYPMVTHMDPIAHSAVITPPGAVEQRYDWPAIIATLDNASLRSALTSIAQCQYGPTTQIILQTYSSHMQAVQQRRDLLKQPAIDFMHHVQPARDMYEEECEELADWQRRPERRDPEEDASETFYEMTAEISAIEEQVKAESSYGTKCNALHAILLIGRNILDAPMSYSDQLYELFQADSCLGDAMLSVVEKMSAIEVSTFLRGKERVTLDAIVDLHGWDMFEDLSGVIHCLRGEALSDDEDEDEDADADEGEDEGEDGTG